MSNLRRPSKNILRRDDAIELLGPYFDDFQEAVREGISRYNELPASGRSDWRPRTHANVLNDYIVKAAQDRLAGADDIHVNEDFEGAIFVVKDRAAIRFKKIRPGSPRPSNIETTRQVGIAYQQEIDGIPKATYIDICYLPNDVWSEIRSVSLACFRGRAKVWEIPCGADLVPYLFDNQGEAVQSRPKVRSSMPKQETGSNG